MKTIVFMMLISAAVFGQSKPDEKTSPPLPTFTKEPAYQMVPHCPAGYEPWYEPKNDGCPSFGYATSNGVGYLDHKIIVEPTNPEDVECRKAGSEPKVLIPTACPV